MMSPSSSSPPISVIASPEIKTNSTSATRPIIATGYLNATDAAALDAELMSTPGYTLEQLMELAGLSVAEAVYQIIQTTRTSKESTATNVTRILIICGPGNNGGDGLVAVRHLFMFGYTNVTIVYPNIRNVKHVHYMNLIQQCKDLDIPVLEMMPEQWPTDYSIIVDAIFGFSFHGKPRPPYDTILDQLSNVNDQTDITTISVDVPSGWNVNGENLNLQQQQCFRPNALVSLTAPKLCAQYFHGRHFVGGRFLPPTLANKYNISMPPYPGTAQVMEITACLQQSSSYDPPSRKTHIIDRSWEADYMSYLAEKEKVQESTTLEPEQSPSEDSWEVQYAAYCADKETKLQQLDDENRMKESIVNDN
jgi:NAD(P)H-hydrate epimerase